MSSDRSECGQRPVVGSWLRNKRIGWWRVEGVEFYRALVVEAAQRAQTVDCLLWTALEARRRRAHMRTPSSLPRPGVMHAPQWLTPLVSIVRQEQGPKLEGWGKSGAEVS